MTTPRRWTLATGLLLLALAGGCQKGNSSAGLGGPRPIDAAREAFNAYDADQRRTAVNQLAGASFGGETPYVKMYRLLMTDPDPTVRAAAVKALGTHGAVTDVPLIAGCLTDADPFVRWEAAKALRKIHNPAAAAPLIEALTKDEDPDVRLTAADALGQYATPAVFIALVSALNDRDHSVTFAAVQSLRTLTGEDHGVDGRAWLEWSEAHPRDLFARRQPYTWQPYRKPAGLLEKAAFWKDRGPESRSPKGLDEDSRTRADEPAEPPAL